MKEGYYNQKPLTSQSKSQQFNCQKAIAKKHNLEKEQSQWSGKYVLRHKLGQIV